MCAAATATAAFGGWGSGCKPEVGSGSLSNCDCPVTCHLDGGAALCMSYDHCITVEYKEREPAWGKRQGEDPATVVLTTITND